MEYKIINASTIWCSTTSDKLLDVDYDKEILYIEDKIFNKGDKVDINFDIGGKKYKTHYKANYLFKTGKNTASISEFLRTDSTDYITPMIGYGMNYFNYNLLVNAYIKAEDYKGNYKDRNDLIFLVYRFLPHVSYTEFEPKLKSIGCYVDSYDNLDKRFTTFVFKCPDRWMEDYNKFQEGRFKNFSYSYKKQLYLFHSIINPNNPKEIDVKNPIYRILEDDPKLREQMEQNLSCEYVNWNGEKRNTKVEIPKDISLKSKPKIINETWKNTN